MTTYKKTFIQTIRTHYFIHFSVMGIFLPYFNLYCYHINFTEFQIGVLSAVRILSMVFFSIIWGLIADYLINRKTAYIICTILSAVIWSFLLTTDNYFYVLSIIFLYSIFYGPIIAFLETYSLEVLQISGEKKSGYGNIRFWGSISFILMAIAIGPIVQRFSLKLVVLLIFTTSVFQALYSFKLPLSHTSKFNFQLSTFKRFFSYQTCFFLFAAFSMQLSHGTYYGFFSIHLEDIGFSPTFIGLAWGMASLSEILIMIKSEYIFKRFSIHAVLLFSFLVTCCRWLVLFYTKNQYLILLSQLLHSITYGAFHMACILYMDKITSKETKTFGQIVNNATSYGLGMMCGFIISGIYFEHYREGMFIFSSLSALMGCIVLFTSFRFKTNRHHIG